jgi:hypothetical protein
MMNGFEDYDNALMEEENILNDVKYQIQIESVQNFLSRRATQGAFYTCFFK